MPDAVLDARGTAVNKIDKNPCSHGACVPVTINRSTDEMTDVLGNDECFGEKGSKEGDTGFWMSGCNSKSVVREVLSAPQLSKDLKGGSELYSCLGESLSGTIACARPRDGVRLE